MVRQHRSCRPALAGVAGRGLRMSRRRKERRPVRVRCRRGLLRVLLVWAVAWGFSQALTAQSADLDPQVVKLVTGVSEERLTVILKKLESFGTRNTLSTTTSPVRGIGAAREWIFQELRSY